MKQIKLTKGQIALVDDEDFEYLSQFYWQAKKPKNSNCFYAVRGIWIKEKQQNKEMSMHRDILSLTDPKIQGEHIDRNGLNNQRSNLRISNQSENCANIVSRPNSVSKYLGVSQRKSNGKWRAEIRKNRIGYRLGEYVNEDDAARAYNVAAIKLHGQFANLNRIQ